MLLEYFLKIYFSAFVEKITRFLVLYVCFVDRCLSFCTFLFYPLCCLFFDIRILITPLVSSNSFRIVRIILNSPKTFRSGVDVLHVVQHYMLADIFEQEAVYLLAHLQVNIVVLVPKVYVATFVVGLQLAQEQHL